MDLCVGLRFQLTYGYNELRELLGLDPILLIERSNADQYFIIILDLCTDISSASEFRISIIS